MIKAVIFKALKHCIFVLVLKWPCGFPASNLVALFGVFVQSCMKSFVENSINIWLAHINRSTKISAECSINNFACRKSLNFGFFFILVFFLYEGKG